VFKAYCPKHISFGQYETEDSFSRNSKKGGGVALLVREGMNYQKLPKIKELTVECHIEMAEIKSHKSD
ncbi:hypothetical protein HHI36_006513, partial [Cryptolaemus montrouzieri]